MYHSQWHRQLYQTSQSQGGNKMRGGRGKCVCGGGGVKDVVEYNENQEERNLREDELMLEE